LHEASIFNKFLVPVDDSVPSLVAQELAAWIAKNFGSKVTVIHVVSHEFMQPMVERFYPEQPDYAYTPVGPQSAPVVRIRKSSSPRFREINFNELTSIIHQRGESIVEDAASVFRESGVEVEKKLAEHADPGETIVSEAEKGAYDLIVIGRSGEKEETPHLGSLAAKVTGRSNVPVLVTSGSNRFSKILASVDGSEAAEKAAEYAGTLAEKMGATVTLLNVQEESLFKLKPQISDIGSAILDKAAKKLGGVKAQQKLEKGDPAKTITKLAQNGNYDLIVMGGRGHTIVSHFLLGSVSDHVLHYSDRAVLIVK